MMNRGIRIWAMVLVALVLASGALGPVAARSAQPEATGEPVMLRLKYATFDPLQGEPQIDSALRADAYPGSGEGAYIVQFKGPVQGAWKERVAASGGRVMGYLPDYAFLVWMDGAVRQRVAALDIVRWVGLYQPAYKLSPNLDRTQSLYRILLFDGADLAAVEARLAALNTPTREVPDELFTLLLPEGGIDQVATWPEVLWIENRPVYRLHNDVATGIMGANVAWDSGYTGDGQIVTVADTGIDSGVDGSTMHPDFRGRFDAIYDWYDSVTTDACGGCDCTIILDGAKDLDGHGTHVLGSVLGDGTASGDDPIKGVAPEAIPVFQAVGQYVDYDWHCNPDVYPDGVQLLGLPDDLGQLFLEARSRGSYIHSDSWGAAENGAYNTDSMVVDQFVWYHPDMLILFSAGNSGADSSPKDGYVDKDSLDAPGTAKNALTVGASDNERDSGGYNPGSFWCYLWGTCWPSYFPNSPTSIDRISDDAGELAAFSSRGPTNDGRIKPDVVAPGTNILSTRSRSGTGPDWGPYNEFYEYMGGTSMATPLTAGAAALVREYYIEAFGHTAPSAALIKATIINSAVDITGYEPLYPDEPSREARLPIPNNHEGWGRVDVGAATSGDRQFEDSDSVETGASVSYTYGVNSSSKPFKVTLVWSDYFAEPSADPTLVNDLNLVVTGPDGSPTYYGNVFDGGWSVTGGSADSINNVESVYVQNPAKGTWTVRVTGANVAEPGGSPQQPFAVVATGWFGPPPPPPIAIFSAEPDTGEAPLEVSFTDQSTGMITDWAWDFGDGGTSTLQNPSHIYTDVGDYTVSLTVIGPDDSDTATKDIHATEPVSLIVDHASGAPGSYFVFTGQNFTLSADATISVNGTDLVPKVRTDASGAVEFALNTVNLSPGLYFVSARTNPSASTYFRLDPDGTPWPDPDLETTILVPGTIGPPEGVYLPLVMRTYPAPDPIVNGNFEDGAWEGWIEASTNNLQVVVKDGFFIEPHSGSWLAWLGGLEDESANIEQTVIVPPGRSYLHYWHWISSSNIDCSTEEAVLLVNGSTVRTYALCSEKRTWDWVEQVVDLGSYAGKSASLQFQATTAQDASSWYVDDVSFQVSAATADAGTPVPYHLDIPIARKVKPAPDIQP